MFELIFLIVVSAYFVQTVLFMIAAYKRFDKISFEDLPTASVIVAARNEEENILSCITSLAELEYPEGKLEIIIVDDDSTDNTFSIVENFIRGKSNFKLIKPLEQIAEKPGKANALANGIKNSYGEIILTTDADCVVPKTWAKTLASYFKGNVAFVGGFTTQRNNKLFDGMQALDFIYLLTVAAGTINLGKPVSCIGNNMSFTRKSYDEIGGYASIPFSVTEDLALIQKIDALNKYKTIYPLDKDSLIVSKPLAKVKSIYRQKKRWGVGGLKTDIAGFIIMATGFAANLASILSLFFLSPAVIEILFFKLISDYLLLYSSNKKLGINTKLPDFIAFEVYYTIYVIILPFIVFLNRNIDWKGRKY